VQVPRLREDLCVREIDGEAVVLDRKHERMHSFNLTAACIVQAIDGRRSAEDISRVLCERFEVEADAALHDTRQVIEQLGQLGLLDDPGGKP
jgi:hypothetical protein